MTRRVKAKRQMPSQKEGAATNHLYNVATFHSTETSCIIPARAIPYPICNVEAIPEISLTAVIKLGFLHNT